MPPHKMPLSRAKAELGHEWQREHPCAGFWHFVEEFVLLNSLLWAPGGQLRDEIRPNPFAGAYAVGALYL